MYVYQVTGTQPLTRAFNLLGRDEELVATTIARRIGLNKEVVEVLKEDGGWDKQSWNKLRKMDSFIKESQRFNPPSLLGFHRIVEDRKGITLHDGIKLPYKTHLCVASQATSNDPDAFPNASQFDGLRYYEMRKDPEESRKHQLAMTDKNHLHFGHGKYSCPGRFFASNEMKMIFACFLLRYDFKYLEGQGRPKNMNIDEFLFVHPETKMLIREKPEESEIKG